MEKPNLLHEEQIADKILESIGHWGADTKKRIAAKNEASKSLAFDKSWVLPSLKNDIQKRRVEIMEKRGGDYYEQGEFPRGSTLGNIDDIEILDALDMELVNMRTPYSRLFENMAQYLDKKRRATAALNSNDVDKSEGYAHMGEAFRTIIGEEIKELDPMFVVHYCDKEMEYLRSRKYCDKLSGVDVDTVSYEKDFKNNFAVAETLKKACDQMITKNRTFDNQTVIEDLRHD